MAIASTPTLAGLARCVGVRASVEVSVPPRCLARAVASFSRSGSATSATASGSASACSISRMTSSGGACCSSSSTRLSSANSSNSRAWALRRLSIAQAGSSNST